MAKKYGTDLTPARRFGRNFALAHGLEPPVDPEALLDGRATIEYTDLPYDWEAIALRRAGETPQIFVHPWANKIRLRFTLCHELGHIVIPWQFGIALCEGEGLDAATLSVSEVEANHFASEVLLPRTWLESQISTEGSAAEMICDIAKTAQVSPITCSFAVAEQHATLATWIESSEGVQYVARSPSCPLSKSASWWADKGALSSAGGIVSSRSIGGGRTLYAVTFGSSERASQPPTATRREVMTVMLRGWTSTEATKVQQQIAGVIGAANNGSHHCKSVEELRHFLAARFLGHKGLVGRLALHELFESYLNSTAHELMARRDAALKLPGVRSSRRRDPR